MQTQIRRPPLMFVDLIRAEQFHVLGSRDRILKHRQVSTDRQGHHWEYVELNGNVYAVSSLGPSWVYDEYARARWTNDYSQMVREQEARSDQEHREKVARAIKDIRLGALCARACWVIHETVLTAKRSVVHIPDYFLSAALWGTDRQSRPAHWRQSLWEILQGLTWLHLAKQGDNLQNCLGADTALLTYADDLRDTPDDECDEDCVGFGGQRHHHYVVNIGRGFLGVLEKLAVDGEDPGVREYDFQARNDHKGTILSDIGGAGQIRRVYLPALLGDPRECAALSSSQHRLLQSIIREITRSSKRGPQRADKAEILVGDAIPSISGKEKLTCDLLEPGGLYVGFNGNKLRKGLGYLLTSSGGWLVKAGYDRNALLPFLSDLDAIAKKLGLCAVGIRKPDQQLMGLKPMLRACASVPGRRMLKDVHLRMYTASNYLDRWSRLFCLPNIMDCDLSLADVMGTLAQSMKQKGISQRALANGIGKDPSFISKIFRGQKPWPPGLAEEAFDWIAAHQGNAQLEPIMPKIRAAMGSSVNLKVALAYLARGWSVVPQESGAKKPRVRWKPYQTELPSVELIKEWWSNWEDAGIALVLGPISDVFAIDVDGEDAHAALMVALGEEPVAPKAFSGSRKPCRYHLFFRHPDFSTKAKSTPWHPNLEFRGQGGIIVLAPSRHASGRQYRWVPGRSLDDLAIPKLPDQILRAIKPIAAPRPRRTSNKAIRTKIVVSNSTKQFLSGEFAEGPNWNLLLFRSACDRAARQVPLGDAEPLLLAGAKPWDSGNEELAKQTIRSAYSQPREPSRH